MILYHFTADRFMESILENGIKRGRIPHKDSSGFRFKEHYQWLTENPERNQSWAEYSTLPYDRTEYKITVKIPKLRMKNLKKWIDSNECKKNQFSGTLNSYGDPENWHIYRGTIFPQWIIEIEKPSEEGLGN